jgi:hypothetical protein
VTEIINKSYKINELSFSVAPIMDWTDYPKSEASSAFSDSQKKRAVPNAVPIWF